MTDERTEGAGVVAGSLPLSMGGELALVRPLTLKESDAWTTLLSDAMAALEVVDGTDGSAIIGALFRASSDAALALVVAYDLDHVLGDEEHIREHMTKRELKAALELMVTVEDPFGEGDARSVVEAFGLPGKLMAAGMAAVTEPMLRLVSSQSSPSPTGDSTTPGTSIPSGPASSSSSRGRTRSAGSARTSKRRAS